MKNKFLAAAILIMSSLTYAGGGGAGPLDDGDVFTSGKNVCTVVVRDVCSSMNGSSFCHLEKTTECRPSSNISKKHKHSAHSDISVSEMTEISYSCHSVLPNGLTAVVNILGSKSVRQTRAIDGSISNEILDDKLKITGESHLIDLTNYNVTDAVNDLGLQASADKRSISIYGLNTTLNLAADHQLDGRLNGKSISAQMTCVNVLSQYAEVSVAEIAAELLLNQ